LKPWHVNTALLLALLVLLALSLIEGSTKIPLSTAVASLAGNAAATSFGWGPADSAMQAIVRELRLPRALLAMMVGASLAMVGALLQTITRNDLADPFLFGLSSGAAAGAVAVISITGDWFGVWTLPLAAFGGALLASVSVLLLAQRSAGQGPERIVLAGLAISFFFGALTHVLAFAGDQRAAHSVLFWSLGGLGLARWDNLPLALAGLVTLCAWAALRHRTLDALLAGDETAHSLGVYPQQLRTQVFLLAAFATACCVALTGVIGFLGLMVPHLARRGAGLLHASLLPTTALLGAALLLGSDLLCRTLLAPQELPVGIVTAGLGAFCVMALLLRRGTATI
jgi:iron complex transport system permease protein